MYFPPSGKAAGCALLVHGGGWHGGNKREWTAQMRRTAEVLHVAGLLMASTNYRLVPARRWPDPVDDVARAIRWIREEAGCDHLVVVGESAGTSVAATAAWGPTRGMTEAFIGFAGIYDLSALPQGPDYDLWQGNTWAATPRHARLRRRPRRRTSGPEMFRCSWCMTPIEPCHWDQSEALAKDHQRTALWRVPGGDHSGPTLVSDALDRAIRQLAGADGSPRDHPHADASG